MAREQKDRPIDGSPRPASPSARSQRIALGGIAALLLTFSGLAVLVGQGATQAIDTAILEMFRVPGDPGEMIGSFQFREAVRDITALGSFSLLTIITVLVVSFLMLAGQRGPALLMLVSVVSGSILSEWLKTLFARPRPEYSAIAQELSASFPSGHAMLSATVFLTIGALLFQFTRMRRLRLFFLAAAVVLTLAVGVTRVMLGVHFPSDVIAGWALGAAWAMACGVLARYLQSRRAL